VAYNLSTTFYKRRAEEMAKEKSYLPSSMGGIVRYFDEYKSKFEITPGVVVIACVVVIVLLILLQIFGKSLMG
jgi:preprotein translocase subunit Sec61beta